jgi:hypothetical protein
MKMWRGLVTRAVPNQDARVDNPRHTLFAIFLQAYDCLRS